MKLVKHTSKKTFIIIALLALLTISGSVGAWLFISHMNFVSTEKDINYNPPTNNEVAEGDVQKDKNRQREALDKNPPVIDKANVYIVDARQYDDVIETRGYIDNVYEEGGKCTAIFTRDNLRFEKSSPSFKDAKTVQCGALDTPRSEFTQAGLWQLVLKYESQKYKGEANATVEIK